MRIQEYHAADFEKRLWRAKVVGDLFTAAPDLPMPPPKERIATMIDFCLDKYSRGNLYALARLLKVNKQSVWKYLRGGDLPYFDTLLNMCSNLSIPPLEFVTANSVLSSISPHFNIDHVEALSRNQGRWSAEKLQYVRQVLESLLTEEVDQRPTLAEVAKQLGCMVESLHRNFPDLCRAIVSQARRKYIDAEALDLMRSTLEKELASNERLPLVAIAQQLGYSSDTLCKYFPEHSQALVERYRGRNNREQARQRLEEVLASNEETLYWTQRTRPKKRLGEIQ